MNTPKKGAPKRKVKSKKNEKGGSKASKSKKRPGAKTPRKGQGSGGAASDDDVEDVFVNRRAKKPKTGRIGRWGGSSCGTILNAAGPFEYCSGLYSTAFLRVGHHRSNHAHTPLLLRVDMSFCLSGCDL